MVHHRFRQPVWILRRRLIVHRQSRGRGPRYCPSSSSTKTPGKLNFYFAVSITVETSSGPAIVTPVYFGQGHTFIHNNWWIGGSAVKYDGSGPAYLTVVGSGQFSISGGTSSFELSS